MPLSPIAAAPRAPQALGVPAERLRVTRLDVAVLIVILACGLAQVRTAFGGDQFLYLTGAHTLAAHGVIYRDFWDLKQPGIYYLYWLAGTLFGFTPAGVHVFEALYQTLFAGVLIAVCSVRLPYRWAASIAPLLTIGAYEASATNYVLGSVEAFAGLPLLVTAICAADAAAGGRGWIARALIAGVAAAAVVSLKLVFAPIVIALWAVAIAYRWRGRGPLHELRVVFVASAGLAVPLLLFAAYLASAHALGLALRTALVDPAEIVGHLRPSSRVPLRFYTKTFVEALWPVMLPALAGVVSLRRRLDALALQMMAWTLVAALLIVAQAWSFYLKFFITIVPVGILAAFGLAALWSSAQRHGVGAKAVTAGAGALLAVAFAATAVHTQRVNAAWADADAQTLAAPIAVLNAPLALPGPIYVFGDPKIYDRAHRAQAVAINGWSSELLLPRQWDELTAELTAAVPAYIVVENGGDDPIPNRLRAHAPISTLLATRYRTAFANSEATVYVRR